MSWTREWAPCRFPGVLVLSGISCCVGFLVGLSPPVLQVWTLYFRFSHGCVGARLVEDLVLVLFL